ncbi:TetR/AcrR family transcriptional regulator [Conexibacter sp. SYSU D00693]|uniref:TetR/AcrR family transcriptional regulator n=1 Tax=Conexibacter sp. SYSU D00693 TaxID=2812560 RepID=UPI00196AA834|nr:TetR/AcrR family transcriptional regulator [Conexibacter sp. SYSU D00693]
MATAPQEQQVPTRERILYAAAELFRRQGYGGTGVKQVITQAQAPFGSLYHFFPEGKEQLGEEVLRVGGRFFLTLFETIADAAPDLETGTREFFTGAGETLTATDFLDACPIGTVAGEVASTHERLRVAADEAFESWVRAFAVRAEAAGVAPEPARALGLQLVALIEGAFLLSRAARSTEAMAAAGDAATALVAAALAR